MTRAIKYATDAQTRSALLHRLNRMQGQIDGLKKALSEGGDCLATMGQVKAVHSAMKHFAQAYVAAYVDRCAKESAVTRQTRSQIQTAVASAFIL